MAISIEQSLASILKSGEALQSFVIDEIALTELLDKAWRPVGKKILKQASAVIDFKKKRYRKQGVPNIAVWLTEDMYDKTLNSAWKKISATAKKFIGKSYQRGIDEEGENPFALSRPAKKTAQKSVASVYAARKKRAVSILVDMAKNGFTSYAHDIAVPEFYNTIRKLGRIDALVDEYEKRNGRPLDADAKEILRYEQARRLRLEAMDKAKAELIDKLNAKLSHQQNAQAIANMVTAKAHHFGFLDWAKENGIQYYKVVAILDARTCAACAAMNGKVFSVKDALAYKDKFLEIQGDKDRLKAEMPFLTSAAAQEVAGLNLGKARALPEIPLNSYRDFAFDGEFEGTYYASEESRKRRDARAKEWGAANYDAFRDSLPKEYIEAIKAYKGSSYGKINDHLRHGEDIDDYRKNILERLNRVFERAPAIPESVITYRGVPDRTFFNNVIKNMAWKDAAGLEVKIDKAFMSSSLVPTVASTFRIAKNRGMQYKIYLPKGSKSAVYIDNIQSVYDNEIEMLIKPGAVFKILQADEETGIVLIRAVE